MKDVAPNSKIYKYHVANLRSLEIAIKNTALSARKAISEENHPATDSFVRLYSFLIGAWAEIRLKKMLYEKNSFLGQERSKVITQSTLLCQWKKAVEIAFRKHFKIPSAEISQNSLSHTAYARFSSLVDILNKDLRSIIEIRNKLAHGQWIYPLNSDDTNIEQEKYRLLNKENLPSLQYKFKLISSLADIINDLIISLPTYKRDFDKHYRHITNTRSNLINRKYEHYIKNLIEKRRCGIQKRKQKRKNS